MNTTSTLARIGFCCKWSERTKKGIEPVAELNNKTTTVSWLNRQSREAAEQRLWDLMVHNLAAIHGLVVKVSQQENHLKMVRLGSDVLPMYTEPSWSYFWRRPDVVSYCEKKLAETGRFARANDVRLSFHPGQFCVLASESADVVNRSIEEFEYHADLVRWMGYGNSFQDFKINVHIAGRAGAEGIRAAYGRLSTEARNCITIENEEITHGLDTCLELSDLVPIVLDIHHHFIHSGEYIQVHDSRVRRVIDSWRGVRPAMHYSVSREDVLVEHDLNVLPDLKILLEAGHNKQKLRAHSDFYWNQAVNDWALGFLEYFDIQCESKSKNLASFALADRAKEIGVI